MSASDTPRTDAVALDAREGITHPELCETYMAWTDYWALRELARQLERELDDTKELLRNVAHAPRGGLAADWWSVAIEQRRKRITAEKECDALRAELAAAKANISDLYEVVRAIVYVAQHGPHDPSPIDENSPLMDAARCQTAIDAAMERTK